MAKYTVSADEYKDIQPLATEGTQVQAIRAFLRARGQEGMNFNLTLMDEAGTTIKVSQAQCAMLIDRDNKENPPEPIGHSFAVVDPVEIPKADAAHGHKADAADKAHAKTDAAHADHPKAMLPSHAEATHPKK